MFLKKALTPQFVSGIIKDTDFEVDDKEKLLNILKKNRNKEINIGMTAFGIHRDDYEFIQNGNNAKEYSSQGIQKLIVL